MAEKKQVKVMTLLFWNAFLAFLNVARQNKWHFFEFWDKTGQGKHILKRKFLSFKNLNFLTWTWPGFGWNVNISVTIDCYVPNDQ